MTGNDAAAITSESSEALHIHALTTSTLLALSINSLIHAQATPCEERIALHCDTARSYPFNAIGKLQWPGNQPNTITSGTAFLVSPHAALTSGHCVFNRGAGNYITATQTLSMGVCRNGNGTMNAQLGSRTVYRQRTNSKWTDLNYSNTRAVDYGAVQFICPFMEVTTFLPLCFGYESDWAQMVGYPGQNLPSTIQRHDQTLAYGATYHIHPRWTRYDAKSTGGASGSPAWDYSDVNSLIRVFAVNSYHHTNCDGGGPRLGSWNESLIRNWMKWEPSLDEKDGAGCPGWTATPWFELVEFFQNNDDLNLKAEYIKAQTPNGPPPTGPSRRYMQVIEGGFYEWVEYDLEPGVRESNFYIQLLAAPGLELPGLIWHPGMDFNPQEPGWLPVEAATVLLSGSAGRASFEAIGIEQTDVDDSGFKHISAEYLHSGDGEEEDPFDDVEFVQDDQQECPGDFNGDGEVNGADLGIMLGVWGDCSSPDCIGDINGDGEIDGADLGLFLGYWGSCA